MTEMNEQTYDVLSRIYDEYQGINGKLWYHKALSVIRAIAPTVRVGADANVVLEGGRPRPRIADLGCGTGSLSVLLYDEGYEIEAVDISSKMLDKTALKLYELSEKNSMATGNPVNQSADPKALDPTVANNAANHTKVKTDRTLDLDVLKPLVSGNFAKDINPADVYQSAENKLYYNCTKQDLVTCSLTKPVDIAVMWLDVINHIETTLVPMMCFNLRNILKPGGFLIGDYLTPEYMEENYYNRSYVDSLNKGKEFVVWTAQYDALTRNALCDFNVFSQNDDGNYTRIQARMPEFPRTEEEVNEILALAGFKVLKNEPTFQKGRNYFVAICLPDELHRKNFMLGRNCNDTPNSEISALVDLRNDILGDSKILLGEESLKQASLAQAALSNQRLIKAQRRSSDFIGMPKPKLMTEEELLDLCREAAKQEAAERKRRVPNKTKTPKPLKIVNNDLAVADSDKNRAVADSASEQLPPNNLEIKSTPESLLTAISAPEVVSDPQTAATEPVVEFMAEEPTTLPVKKPNTVLGLGDSVIYDEENSPATKKMAEEQLAAIRAEIRREVESQKAALQAKLRIKKKPVKGKNKADSNGNDAE